ncbi:MAG: restriction endonuclease subunit S [Polaromonas sp.]
MKSEMGALVSIQAGFPFRGAIDVLASGSVLVVQMKDVAAERGIDWSGVIRTELTGRKAHDWLQPGDVLFVSRGTRFYAVCVDQSPGPAVCGPHFFHLRLKPCASVLPAFLAWQINQPPFQRQLWQAAEGSSQLSIRRPVLEALSLSVPSLQNQRRIVALAELARQERQALHQLIRNRELQLEALAENLA